MPAFDLDIPCLRFNLETTSRLRHPHERTLPIRKMSVVAQVVLPQSQRQFHRIFFLPSIFGALEVTTNFPNLIPMSATNSFVMVAILDFEPMLEDRFAGHLVRYLRQPAEFRHP